MTSWYSLSTIETIIDISSSSGLTKFLQPFTIECDAPTTSVGAVLLQGEHSTAFFSKALKGRNQLLWPYDKELLVLMLRVNKWKGCLLGQQFLVKTDHHSLKHLWQQTIITKLQEKWLVIPRTTRITKLPSCLVVLYSDLQTTWITNNLWVMETHIC